MENFKAAVSTQVVEGLIESQKGKKMFTEKRRQQVHKAKGILKKIFK